MLGRSLLTPLQFARLCASIGWHPENVVGELTDASFAVADERARRLAYEAFIERRRLDALEDAASDAHARARLAEHDLDVSIHAAGTPQPEPGPEEIREAHRLAVGMRLVGLASVDVLLVLRGALLLCPEVASTVAEAAVEQYPDVVERPWDESPVAE